MSSDVLLSFGFILKEFREHEYSNVVGRWYYGDYLYLVIPTWNTNMMILYIDGEVYGGETVKVDIFDIRYDTIVDIKSVCVDWYKKLLLEYMDKVKEFENKINEIKKYI